jgi:hypothetical protein
VDCLEVVLVDLEDLAAVLEDSSVVVLVEKHQRLPSQLELPPPALDLTTALAQMLALKEVPRPHLQPAFRLSQSQPVQPAETALEAELLVPSEPTASPRPLQDSATRRTVSLTRTAVPR